MDKEAHKKWQAAFEACDINGNGFIEPSELHKVFEKLNVKLDATSQKNLVRFFFPFCSFRLQLIDHQI